jgi:flagellar basal body-associated protein FliL
MIQVKNKRIIILLVILLLLVGLIFIFLKFRPSNEVKKVENVEPTKQIRMMTDSEKEMVGIDKNQKAEVINDDTGFFIYNVVE